MKARTIATVSLLAVVGVALLLLFSRDRIWPELGGARHVTVIHTNNVNGHFLPCPT